MLLVLIHIKNRRKIVATIICPSAQLTSAPTPGSLSNLSDLEERKSLWSFSSWKSGQLSTLADFLSHLQPV